ncbi:MAG: hypothetical protein AMXMBFR33_31710 [Candidatus Xenobia bacterium]
MLEQPLSFLGMQICVRSPSLWTRNGVGEAQTDPEMGISRGSGGRGSPPSGSVHWELSRLSLFATGVTGGVGESAVIGDCLLSGSGNMLSQVGQRYFTRQ